MQSAASTRNSALLNARGEQAAGGLLILTGVATAPEMFATLSEGFFNDGAAGIVDAGHVGGFAYFGTLGPLGAGGGTIAVLNAYAEEWPTLKRFRFEYAVPVLVVLFLLPYRSLCLRLIERTGLRPGLIKEQYSDLFQAYALFTGAAIVSLIYGKGQNSRLEVFAFIVFVCALHVPMFAFGRSKIGEFVVRSGIALPKAPPDISWGFFITAIAILGTPLVLALIVEAFVRDDYRLFAIDAVMTAIIFSLLVISGRGQFKGPVSEHRANHGAGGSSLSQSL